jgi:hypothetical protein
MNGFMAVYCIDKLNLKDRWQGYERFKATYAFDPLGQIAGIADK